MINVSKRVKDQAAFLRDMVIFLQWIDDTQKWVVVTGDEYKRTPYQQAKHYKDGVSDTLESDHLDRRAWDLCFYYADTGIWVGNTDQSKRALSTIGEKWKSMDKKNEWGGDFKMKNGKPDTPHFARTK